jgi:hypothetical protein
MVVQAAPGTLALTPNREALSSSKMTEDGLTDLCVALVARIEDDIIKQIPASILQAVERLTKHDYLRCGLEHYASLSDAITPVPVRRYLSSQLGAAKYSKYVAMLKQAEHRGFKNSHTFTNKSATHEYHRLRRRLSDKGWQKKEELKFAFLKHFILRPLSRVFQKHPKLLKRSEFHHAHDFSYHSSQRKDSLLAHLDPADFSGMQQMIDHPTVFITTRTKYLDKSIKCCPDVTDSQDTWVYKIAPRDSNKDVIVKAFEESGMKVIDLTLNHEWDDVAAEIEEEKIRRNANRKPIASVGAAEKKSANLLMSLSNVYDDEGKRKASVGMIKLMEGDLETSNTPVFYVPVESVSSTGSLGRFGYYLDLTADERKHGVIVRSGVEKNMAIKRGAVHMDAYLAKQLWDRIRTPEFAAYRTKQRKEGLFDEHHISAHYVELMEYLGIKLTGFDKLTVNPVFDRAAALISNLSAVEFFNQVPGITQEELTHYKEVISHYKLEELPFITKIKALKQDDMLSRLFLGSGCLDLVKQFPERKAALKSLVMSVFKSGPTNE